MVPAQLPATIGGMRTRFVVMDRLHVKRSYATEVRSRSRCMPRPALAPFDPLKLVGPRTLDLR